ncbi:LysR substrate-binding domain-containing protein [Phyllobacterium sp. P30BS-XVII]|uniref:LysR substrate-binding domain-containing protein n=1 Tax=Phyllobacterium sp. P30BS-XVII TaxID=2587046 RepID=UPI000DD7B632|nr:LysR substrate-binding domain-containing protein [Phyllobacterium sp. P30BS-XVII]MBA8903883.1 DNA-binding transcriptional LysR family regulator [Phyllobacterium sp. P30BS-XVII]
MSTIHTTRAGSFELRHLRYFVALVEEHNFERAAARLGIAQPGLSQQIINLESIVGVPLLDRSRRSVRLTASGQLLFEEAKKVLAQADATLAALKRVGRGETGRISIGYVASAAHCGVLIATINGFRQAYPDVELQLVEMEMLQQLTELADGTLDFSYIRPPAPIPSGITTSVILREPLVVALPDTHPLASSTNIDLIGLSKHTFIAPRQSPDVGFHRNTILACNEAGFQPVINPNGRDFLTIASMVAVGLGIALVPKSLDCLHLPGIRYIPIIDNKTTSELAVAHRKTEASPTVRAFILHNRAVSSLPV